MEFLPFLVATAVSAIAVAALAVIARRVGAVARTLDDDQHLRREIPHLGGPGLLLALLPWFPFDHGMVLIVFCAIGTFDDIRPLRPIAKALLMLVPSMAAGWVTGEIWVGVLIWFVANAVNLLDHADGLAATTSGIGYAFAGSIGGMAGAGACFGFLFHNFPPARSFMGDGGSLMIGAGLVLVWYDAGPIATVAWCAVPLADAVFVTVRRIVGGKRPWIGGTDHTGHILLRKGFPPRLLPFIYAAAAAIVGVSSMGPANIL